MKKFNVLFCVLLILFTFTACTSNKEIKEDLTTTAAATTAAVTQTSQVTTLTQSSSVLMATVISAETSSAANSTSTVTTSAATTHTTTVPPTTVTTVTTSAATKPTTKKQPTTKASTSAPTTSAPTTTEATTTKAVTKKVTSKPATKPTTTAPTIKTTAENKKYCTVKIECSTIYNNLSKLKNGKKNFLPANGVILDNVQVELKGRESAFDVIKKACEENTCTDNCKYCKSGGVQIEYTYTPAFNNYYIEGIHQIYEKDCGTQSGWMYSVNGKFPDEGSSSYIVSPGDVVALSFTCNMGEDIGNYY